AVDRKTQIRHRGAARRVAQLRRARQVADQQDLVEAGHLPNLLEYLVTAADGLVAVGGRSLLRSAAHLLTDRNPGPQKAQDALVQLELALELLDHRGLGGNVQHGIGSLTLLVDVVREPALPPVL